MKSLMDISLQEAANMSLEEIEAMKNAELEKLRKDHEYRQKEIERIRKGMLEAAADHDKNKIKALGEQLMALAK